MSYPHISPETANGCSTLAYAYDVECYCTFYWAHADYLPRMQYYGRPTKWIEVGVWRCGGPDKPDRFVTGATAESGPELLRNLATTMAAITSGDQPDPSLLATDHNLTTLRAALRHPMLGGDMLLHSLDTLLPHLPPAQAHGLTTRLHRVISQRESEVYQPPEGAGWIASAPQTTEDLKAWSP